MRRLVLGLIWITGCYSPSVRSDVPCAEMTDACPDGQSCVGGFCVTSGMLGIPDAMPGTSDAVTGMADRDRDGIADSLDNCPDVANPDQANEDGDAAGDACDVCPQIADNGADADGDGIGDACDPNPGAKDTQWLFNGFGGGLPAWSRTTNWNAGGGSVTAMAAGNTNNDSEYMVAPFTATGVPDNFAVTITVSLSGPTGSNGDHSAGIEIFDSTASKGVDCAIDQMPAGQNSILYLQDEFNNGLSKSVAFAWTTGTQYRILIARHGASYTCSVVGPSGTSASLTGTSNIVPRDGNTADFWVFGATGQFGSVEIIGTP